MFYILLSSVIVTLVRANTLTVGYEAVGMEISTEKANGDALFYMFDKQYYLSDGGVYNIQNVVVSGPCDESIWSCPEGFCSDSIDKYSIDDLNKVYSCNCVSLKINNTQGFIHNDKVIQGPLILKPVFIEMEELESVSDLVVKDNKKAKRIEGGSLPACDFYPSYVNNILFIRKSSPNSIIVKVEKDNFRQEFVCYGNECQVDLPQNLKLKSGSMDIEGWAFIDDLSFVCHSETIYVTGVSLCRLRDCVICYDAVKGFNCLPASQKSFLIFFFCLLIALAIIAFPVSLAVIATILLVVKNIIKMVYGFIMRMMRTDRVKNLTKSVEELKDSLLKKEDGVENQVEAPKTDVESADASKKKKKSSWKVGALDFLVIIMFLPFVVGCDESLIIPSSFTNCIDDGTIERCNVTFSGLVTMPFLGSTACLSFTDLNSNEVFQIELTYSDLVRRINQEQKYYTSAWVGASAYKHACKGSTCDGSKCDDFDQNRVPVTTRISSTSVVSYPGEQYCHRGCGCVSCGGCGSCSASCVYHAFGIRPLGTIYQVKTLGSQVNMPTVRMKLIDEDGNTERETMISQGSPGTMSGFKVSIIGLFDSVQYDMHGRDLLIGENGKRYLAQTAGFAAPQPNAIGDIQGSTRSSLVTPSRVSFKYGEGIAKFTESGQKASYTYTSPGIFVLNIVPALPTAVDGQIWYMEGNNLQTNLTVSAALALSMESLGTFRIARKTSLVCPVSSIINSTGCFSCPIGMRTIVNLHSTCADGSVTFTTESPDIYINTPVAMINGIVSSYAIDWLTNTQEGSFTINIIGTGGNTSVSVDYIASPYEPEIGSNNQTGGETNNESSKGYGDFSGSEMFTKGVPRFFKRMFNGIADKWWEIILTMAMWAGVAYVAFVGVSYTLSKKKTKTV